MLVLWRRHADDCPHIAKGRDYQKCRCPIWIDWRINSKRIRKPLDTRDWQVAVTKARELEIEGINTEIAPQGIKQACVKFLQDATARSLREASHYKYRLLFKQLEAFCCSPGLTFLSQLTVEELRLFRESWPNKNMSARKKLEHLKAAFRFFHGSD
jgi:hypothetical protein